MEKQTIDVKPFLINASKLVALIVFIASVTWGVAVIKIGLENRVKLTEQCIEDHEQRIDDLENWKNEKDLDTVEIKSDLKYIKEWVTKQEDKK